MQPLRLLLFEHCSTFAPGPLARAGGEILRALVEAFANLEGVAVVTVPPEPPADPKKGHPQRRFLAALNGCDAALVVAPESGGLLRQYTRLCEEMGKGNLGCPSAAVALTGDKAACLGLWRQAGLPVPESALWDGGAAPFPAPPARPFVLKPNCGAGGEGARLCNAPPEQPPPGHWLVQPYIPGAALSVSCLVQGDAPLPLSLNLQRLEAGGFGCAAVVILDDDPREAACLELARAACAALPGLRGFVGVDMVEGPAGPVLMELNARPTLAFAALPPERRRWIAQKLVEGLRRRTQQG